MVSIVRANRDGFVSYDVYLNGEIIGRFASYFRAVALVMLLGE